MADRKAIETLLAKLAKAAKAEVGRAIPHGHSKSGLGAFQAKVGGNVKVTVRDHDVVIYTPFDVVKVGRRGPKGWEHVTILNHNTDTKLMEKAFKVGLGDKKANSEWAKSKGATLRNKKVETPADIRAQRKALEKQLAELKKQEMTLSKPKPKREPQAKKKTEVLAAVEMVANNA